jgi:uncharacterized protein (DUF2267 family)
VDFVDHVRPALTGYPSGELIDAASAVFEVLQRHVLWGEGDKIAKTLPDAISTLWKLTVP